MSTEAEDQRQRAKRSRASDDGEDDAIESPGVTPVTRLESPDVTPAEEKAPDDTPVDEEEDGRPVAQAVRLLAVYGDGIAWLHRLGIGGEFRGAHQLGC
jgi:hypothetical protein